MEQHRAVDTEDLPRFMEPTTVARTSLGCFAARCTLVAMDHHFLLRGIAERRSHTCYKHFLRRYQQRIAMRELENALAEHMAVMEATIHLAASPGGECLCADCFSPVSGVLCQAMSGATLHWGCAQRRSPEFARKCNDQLDRALAADRSRMVSRRFHSRPLRVPSQRESSTRLPTQGKWTMVPSSSPGTRCKAQKSKQTKVRLSTPAAQPQVQKPKRTVVSSSTPAGQHEHNHSPGAFVLSQRSCRPFCIEGALRDMTRSGLISDLGLHLGAAQPKSALVLERRPRVLGDLATSAPRIRVQGGRQKTRRERARYGLRGIRIGEASHPGPPDPSSPVLGEAGLPQGAAVVGDADDAPPAEHDPYAAYETGSEGSNHHAQVADFAGLPNPFAGIFGPAAPVATVSQPGAASMQMDIQGHHITEIEGCAVCGERSQLGWPVCGHPFCFECTTHHARARRVQHMTPGERLPPLSTLRNLPCPCCRRGFGTDEAAAQGTYRELQEAAQHLDLSPPAPLDGSRSQPAAGLPQPRPPESMFCLCHRLLGGYPDFRPLFERRMHWAPTAEHGPTGEVTAWTEEWLCNGCSGSVSLASAWPTQPHVNCPRCQGESVWVFDAVTQAGEWRCTQCMQDAFVASVGAAHRLAGAVASPQLSSQPAVGPDSPPPTTRAAPGRGQPPDRSAQLGPAPPALVWPQEQLRAFEVAAQNGVEARIHELAGRLLATGAGPAEHTRWSPILVPWLWLAAEENSSLGICMYLAALAGDAPVALTGEAGPDYIRRLWHQTRNAMRILGITSAASLYTWLQGHRGELLTWMQADSRYRAMQPGPAPAHVGMYMQDYEQEFLISRLVAAGADAFHVLGAVLIAVVQAASLHIHAAPASPGVTSAAQASRAGQVGADQPNRPTNGPPAYGPLLQEAEQSDEEMAQLPASAIREPRGPPRAAWVWLDEVDLSQELRIRVPCLKAVPRFLRAGLKSAYSLSLDALQRAYRHGGTQLCKVRAWKLFMLTSRMILHKSPGEANLPKESLLERSDQFQRGEWSQLLTQSRAGALRATARESTRDRRSTEATRVSRAQELIEKGEVSSARQALMAEEVAPGTAETLGQLRDPARRLQQPREPLPQLVQEFVPAALPEMPIAKFLKNLRSSKRGGASGPSGTTAEHLQVLLDDEASSELLHRAASQLAAANVPEEITAAIRLGRLTALRKRDGGVRGIVVGDILRRLVARTLAQEFNTDFEEACAPFQYALSTRAGTECVAHVFQALSDASPDVTILSIDGIGAYDLIHLEAGYAFRLAGHASCLGCPSVYPNILRTAVGIFVVRR